MDWTLPVMLGLAVVIWFGWTIIRHHKYLKQYESMAPFQLQMLSSASRTSWGIRIRQKPYWPDGAGYIQLDSVETPDGYRDMRGEEPNKDVAFVAASQAWENYKTFGALRGQLEAFDLKLETNIMMDIPR